MDQPMPPEMAAMPAGAMPPEAMPPEAMPPEAMPPEAMPTTADDVMAAAEQETQAQIEVIASQVPTPTEAYDIKVVGQLVNELNKLLEAVNDSAGQMLVPPVMFEPPAGQKSWNQPLPREVWLNVNAVSQAAAGIEGGRFRSSHGFDPSTMDSTGALRQVSAKFRIMAKDQNFVDALASTVQGSAPAAEPMAPEPMDAMEPEMMPEDDDLLQEAV